MNQQYHHIPYYLFAIACVSLLFFSFRCNTFQLAEPEWFQFFQRDSEAKIVARIIESEQSGWTSHGGLLGRYAVPDQVTSSPAYYQYELFENEQTPRTAYTIYGSQHGGAGWLFSWLNNALPLSNTLKLSLFYSLMALLNTMAILLFLRWVWLRFDPRVAWITLLCILFSNWIILFGRNLYWMLWAFYLPFLGMLHLLEQERRDSRKHSLSKVGLGVFVFLFLKCLFTGYEFITTSIIMVFIPFVYYSLAHQWERTFLIKRMSSALVGCVLAIGCSLILLAGQLSAEKGSWSDSVAFIQSSLEKRTYGTVSLQDQAIAASTEASVFEVLGRYLKGSAVNLNHPFGTDFLWLRLPFIGLLFIFLVCSLLLYRINWSTSNRALVLTCWLSISAPLSWFVLFKGHSYIHTHVNFIIWYLPFGLLGFVVIGQLINDRID